MLVKWNIDRLNRVPVIEKGKEVDPKVESSAQGSTTVLLKPGYNDVSKENWKLMKPLLKFHIKEKNIEIIEKEFSELEYSKKKEVLADTNFPEIIEAWIKKEPDPASRLSLENRLRYINKFIETGKKEDYKER
jgi:hypothetical protein